MSALVYTVVLFVLFEIQLYLFFFSLDSKIGDVSLKSPTGSSVVLMDRSPHMPGRKGVCEMNKSSKDQKVLFLCNYLEK